MEPTPPAKPPQSLFFGAGLIVLLTVAAYCNSLSAPFLFDDIDAIAKNTTIRTLWPIWKPLCPPGHGETVSERPVLNLSLALNYALGGLEVRGYHTTNLAIHVLAALLLFGIVRRTAAALPELCSTGSPTIFALAVALVWAVHPLQTESVTYVVQRAESLMGLFFLLILYCFIRAAASTKPRLWYAGSLLACLLGMATKEVTIIAPLLVFLYDRTFLCGSFREAWRRHRRYYLASAATALLLVWLIARNTILANFYTELAPYTWWSYLLTQQGVIVSYLRRAFWPSGLCLYLGWMPAATVGDVLLPAIPVVSLLGLTLWALAKRSAWGFLGAWFFLILAPTSSFVPLTEPIFEHRMYLPLAAIVCAVLAAGWLLAGRLARRGKVARTLVPVGAACLTIAVVAALAITTYRRNQDYHSDVGIWEDTLRKAPHNCRARVIYGNLLKDHGQLPAAIVQYRKILEFNPCSEEAHNNLGDALLHTGKFDEALAHLRTALQISPDNGGAFYNNVGLAGRSKNLEVAILSNMAVVFTATGRFDDAIDACQKALKIKPNDIGARNNLGTALYQRGRVDESIAAYREVLQAQPEMVEACNSLGFVLAERGQVDESIAYICKALKIYPEFVEAHQNLDYVLLRKGNLLKTLAPLRDLLRARPNDTALLNNTAWLSATSPISSARDGAEAVALAQRAVELSQGKNPEILCTLAAAYAEAARFADALATARNAADLARQQGHSALAESIEAKLRLYQAGKPFHQP